MRTGFFAALLVLTSTSLVAAAEVVTLGGTGKDEHSGDGGPAVKAGIGGPFGLTIGPDGGLYVCETTTHAVRRIDLKSGMITTVAGTGKKGYAGDGGPAREALLNEPYEVRFDSRGNMLFVEMQNQIVRKVDARTGVISTIAGTGKKGFSGDGGPAIRAEFSSPHSIALDSRDRLFICDIGNHRLRAVDPSTGFVTTVSGTGEKKGTPDGAPLAGTPLNGPRTLDFDAKRGLFLALREGNAVYRIDLERGTLHHLAGTGKSGYAGDGGPARDAQLAGPKGLALAPNGDIYLADTESHTIRVMRAATGKIETVVGDGKAGDGPDGDPRRCRLNRPHGVFVDRSGNFYIGDSSNNKVRFLRLSTGI
ncbi:MAG: hypothetical protein IT428_07915 [Planctomycetaceae bacterium]|nr:hypothetical protein [Planctomycetaceae bacterium]